MLLPWPGKTLNERSGSRGKVVQDRAANSPSARAGSRTVLVICATFRDHRELPRLVRPGFNYVFHDYASTSLEELIGGRAEGLDGAADPIAEVARIRAGIGDREIAAVVSTDDYPGATLAAVVAQELGLPGPDTGKGGLQLGQAVHLRPLPGHATRTDAMEVARRHRKTSGDSARRPFQAGLRGR